MAEVSVLVLSIVVDSEIDEAVLAPLLSAFNKVEIFVAIWSDPEPIPMGTDAIVMHVDRVPSIKDQIAESSQQPRLIALSSNSGPADTRRLLSTGVTANIPLAGSVPVAQVFAIVAAATGIVAGLPQDHAHSMATQLENPPRQLTADEGHFLGLAATRTIEAAGTAVGLSRRQAQRRFRRLCDDLDLADHHIASVKAARWGLVDAAGHPTTPPAR